jgi:endonuclease III
VSQQDVARDLVREHGQTYAEQAGITLRDKPSPLFQLLVLTMLSSARIAADVAVASAQELFAAGWRTPEKLRDATWQERVDALVRGGYRRYDESTSTQLEKLATHVIDVHDGDLRGLRPTSHEGVDDLLDALTDVPRIGDTGAAIFCREVQVVWPEVSPFFDKRALASARGRGLPADPAALADLAPRGKMAALATALVRADLDG